MILASAIKYYIEATGEIVVLCGPRHGDIFKQLQDLGFEPKKGYKEIEQGFITHDGKFLNRVEAFNYAKEIGQVSEKVILDREKTGQLALISEDLW